MLDDTILDIQDEDEKKDVEKETAIDERNGDSISDDLLTGTLGTVGDGWQDGLTSSDTEDSIGDDGDVARDVAKIDIEAILVEEQSPKVPAGTQSGNLVVPFFLCLLGQALAATVMVALSVKDSTAATAASGVALAFGVPVVVLAIMQIVKSVKQSKGDKLVATCIAACAAVSLVFSAFMLVPNLGQMYETNPYSNNEKLQCIATFVVGQEFVMPGTMASDGYVVKVSEKEEIDPPQVLPKPGLTFIGWRYSGVGDPDIVVGTPIYLDANGLKNNSVTLYATYVDGTGTTYCACGSMEENLFEGAEWQGMGIRTQLRAAAVALGLLLVALTLSLWSANNGTKGK